MTKQRTPQQKVAALELQLAKAKAQHREEERRIRTRSLIKAGAMLCPELRIALESLSPEQLAEFNQRALRAFKALADIPVSGQGALTPDRSQD